MGFSGRLTWSLSKYLLTNKLRGIKRFPLVLMLEPLFRCNLECAGCGRIREYSDILDQTLSLEDCLAAVEEAGAPVVSITGGEPLLLPDIEQIVAGIIANKRFVNLCTNGVLLEESLHKFKPSPYISFVLHLDGLAEIHDEAAGQDGVFDTAIRAMKAAKKTGFQVLVNTTIYKGRELKEIEQLFVLLSEIPVDGIMVAPAFGYEEVDADVFLTRSEAIDAFRPIFKQRRRFPFYNTPLYLEHLAGKIELPCSPWSTVTRNPKGWKKPCYLITDGHCASYRELMDDTDWSRYGSGNDPRCEHCMVHCGYEASAVDAALGSLPNLWRTMKWNFFRR
ncbi:adenosyl-hopene transferase HpnH [Candidatus Bipolaricaulota bacterium]